MRQLSIQDLHAVSAAGCVQTNTLSIATWQQLHADATREATFVGVMGATLAGGIALSVGAPALGVALAATIAGGAVYQYEYVNFELWPWNY
jgi:hypothetical protein